MVFKVLLDLRHSHSQLVMVYTYHANVVVTAPLVWRCVRAFNFIKKPKLKFLTVKNNNVGRVFFSIMDYLCLILFLLLCATDTGLVLLCLCEFARWVLLL